MPGKSFAMSFPLQSAVLLLILPFYFNDRIHAMHFRSYFSLNDVYCSLRFLASGRKFLITFLSCSRMVHCMQVSKSKSIVLNDDDGICRLVVPVVSPKRQLQ